MKLKDMKFKPYMTGIEIQFMTDLLTLLRPKLILEWGAGYSTLYYSQLIKCKWYSIEHNSDWYKKILNNNIYNNIKINLIVKQVKSETPDNNPYHTYIYYPLKTKQKFDFILVDGLSITRKKCIEVARDIIEDDGVVVLHDADRTVYHDAFDNFNNYIRYSKLSKKTRGTGGIWVASKSKKMIDYLREQLKHYDNIGD